MINKVASAVNAELDRLLSCPKDAPYAKLYEAMRYSALSGGKRIRPYLCAEFYMICSGKSDFSPALPYAAAVEMIHTSSLIHDDLPAMDNDVLRRGKPTNHMVYGVATAILAGDTLLLKGCETAASNPYMTDSVNSAAAALTARKACGMMAGQQTDLLSSVFTATERELIRLQSLKTGCLLSLSCMLGSLAAGYPTDVAESFGDVYGLLFQMTDDLLDCDGTAETGKSRGKDERDHKATFVTLLGEKKTRDAVSALCARAQKLLSPLPDCEGRDRLIELCASTAVRKK